MNNEKAKDLLMRYRAGRCTDSERKLVEDWILSGASGPMDLDDMQLLNDLLEIRIRLSNDLKKQTKQRLFTRVNWLPYTAAAVLLAALTITFFLNRSVVDRQLAVVNIHDIAPGGNRASLTLPDGRTIALSEGQDGIIAGDDLRYFDGDKVVEDGLFNHQQQAHAVLSTPKGGTYQILLPDGTKVWLNAASTLTYPAQFSRDERVVEINGEGYFAVAKDKNIPFKVVSREQEILVLGTEFNISAYGDEPSVKTTLIKGSVQVTPTGHSAPTILQPGQQADVRDTEIAVKQVDVSSHIGWKDGYFIFDGTDLRDAMNQLSRWYNVEVIYDGVVPPTPFYGKINRNDSLAKVLDILKEGKVNFQIKNSDSVNQLIVMP